MWENIIKRTVGLVLVAPLTASYAPLICGSRHLSPNPFHANLYPRLAPCRRRPRARVSSRDTGEDLAAPAVRQLSMRRQPPSSRHSTCHARLRSLSEGAHRFESRVILKYCEHNSMINWIPKLSSTSLMKTMPGHFANALSVLHFRARTARVPGDDRPRQSRHPSLSPATACPLPPCPSPRLLFPPSAHTRVRSPPASGGPAPRFCAIHVVGWGGSATATHPRGPARGRGPMAPGCGTSAGRQLAPSVDPLVTCACSRGAPPRGGREGRVQPAEYPARTPRPPLPARDFLHRTSRPQPTPRHAVLVRVVAARGGRRLGRRRRCQLLPPPPPLPEWWLRQ